jgi:putative acetyltransferase
MRVEKFYSDVDSHAIGRLGNRMHSISGIALMSISADDEPDLRRDRGGLEPDRNRIDLFQATLPEHIRDVRTLFEEYGQSLGFSLCFQSFEQELQNLPGLYAPPSGRLILARYRQRAAGCIALRKLDDKICEMKRLYVRPECRGHKLGQSLVGHLIADARLIGYERMRLDTVASSMAGAVALYRSLGFHEIPPYSSIPVETALWMELVL